MPLRWLVFLSCLLAPLASKAQMWNGQDTLYGNEWIDFSKTYYKIKVAEDGIYRIDYQTLITAGFPAGSVPANRFRLYRYGVQEPVFTTTDGFFASGDFLEFFGEKNRDEVDRFLFDEPEEENLSPWISLFNDTTTYYLTWENTAQPLRYSTLANDLSNLPPKEPYCWFTSQATYITRHLKRRITPEITYSWFNGEGFGRGYNLNTTVPLPIKKLYAAGPPATVRVRYGADLDNHKQNVSVNDSLFFTDVFSGWKVQEHDFQVGNALLTGTTRIEVESALGGSDRHVVSGGSIRYSRQWAFENAAQAFFEIDSSGNSKYLEIQAFDLNGGAPVLYDLTNKKRLETVVSGNLAKAKLPPSPLPVRRFVLVNPLNGIHHVAQIEPVQFHDFRPDNADFVILSTEALFADLAANGANRVEEYADYRRSASGGNFNVAVVDVNDLYEQFGYGIRFHPIAIRNFCHYIKKHWQQPKYLLIIGKGLEYSQFHDPAVQSTLADSLFFVPTFGAPGADLLFVMNGNRVSEPIFPIGRIAATRPAEIRDYLDKVIEHEQVSQALPQTLAAKAWLKRAVHLSGGLANESGTIKNNVLDMGNVLASGRLGADVHTFYKTSGDPVQQSAYEQIVSTVNDGAALWMIFGHSSSNAVDFDIGTPNAYHNAGRYPVMMVMGCFSGQCSNMQQGLGEQFLLAPQRGAIAWFASVNFSSVEALHQYGRRYYELLSGPDYGKSVGETLQHTIASLQTGPDNNLTAVLHQNLLQGDPAIRMNVPVGPDYLIDNQTFNINPNPVGLDAANFDLKFDLVNLGENTGDLLPIQIEQRLPDNSILPRLADTLAAPAWRQALQFTLPTKGSKPGFNRFFAMLDPGNQIAEQPMASELNNSLLDGSGQPGVDVFFYSDDVQPLAPEPYGIVNQANITLRVSTLNTGPDVRRYLFEMDTAAAFDSPGRVFGQLEQRGGLLEWKPPMVLKDSTVYYWRVARDSLVNGAVVWRNRSFTTLFGSTPGWNQQHFGQWLDDRFVNLALDSTTRQFAFSDNAGFVAVSVAWRGMNRYPGLQNIHYEGSTGDFGWNQEGIQSGVLLMVQEPNGGHVVLNPAGGPHNPDTSANKFYFHFNTADTLERQALIQFIDTEIPAGYYVGLLAFNRTTDTLGYAPRRWAADSLLFGKNLFQTLEAQGAEQVRQLTEYPVAPPAYGLIFRKNDPGFGALDTIVIQPDSVALIRHNFTAKWAEGYLETPPIGPAKAWKSLYWQTGATDDPSDQVKLSVLGIRPDLADTLLLRVENGADTSLTAISAVQFPKIKLRYETSDTLTRSATQPGFIRVLFDAVPEGALHPVARYDFYRDTLQEGDNLRFATAFANVSDAGFDSLLVRFRVENPQGVGVDILKKFRPLPAGDTLHTTLSFNTFGQAGPRRLLLDVNPGNAQAEQFHFNNVAVQNFFVLRDLQNPLLDVTFDGQHIFDGELVSPKPEIVVTLKDENRFLAIQDTSVFSLTLILPDGSAVPLAFNDPSVIFYPADAGQLPKKNLARLEWRPVFTQDGEYQLRVNGRDVSGNASGALDFAVNFKVITKSSFSNLLNYPNPFSTSTCFVYTMTGAEPPAFFRIQIMTVSGKVVREITGPEFGPMLAGTHQSSYCWDGRDEFGDQLANGVYLYRVTAKKANGEEFEFFDNASIDGFFKNGMGKMVLMR